MEEIKTELLGADSPETFRRAGEILRAGEVAAIPTETVYGLAADATNAGAVAKIFKVKGRPQDNPLIVHVSSTEMWRPLVKELPKDALALAKAFWPGPLTIILEKSGLLPAVTCGGLSTVGVRMPAHPAALAIIGAAGKPLAAPSANLSGSPSPTTARHCVKDLWGKVPLIVDGGPCEVGIESTVLSLAGEPVVLRPGAITPRMIEAALGKPVGVSHTATEPLASGEQAGSPGMKYKHYAPKAKVVLVSGRLEGYLELLERAPKGAFGLVFEGEEKRAAKPCVVYGREHEADSQARGLFAALRELDERGAKLVYARAPDSDGEGLGVYNRMIRAAAFEVIEV